MKRTYFSAETGLAVVALAALFVPAAAVADIPEYHLVWVAQTPAHVDVNDYHIDISYEQPATVIAPSKFWKGAFNRVTPEVEAGNISVHWDQPGHIGRNQAMIVGFDFSIDKPFEITRKYWTWNGDHVADSNDEIEIEKVGSKEPFEQYPQGHLPGQGGWQPMFGDNQFGDFNVVDFIGAQTPKAIEIDQLDNAVHPYDGFDDRVWLFQTWQFIPGDFQSGGNPNDPNAGSWFFLFNTYDDGTNTAIPSVATQVNSWNGSANFYIGDPNQPVSVPYIVDQWVPIDVIVDLESDHTAVFYDGQFVAEYQWTAGAFGDNGGQPSIAAVDLWGNGSSPIFYDDMIIEELPHEPTLKLVDPKAGAVLSGGLDEVLFSDDQYLTTRSGFGSSFIDLHKTELRVVFDFRNADMLPPIPFDIMIESALKNDERGLLHLFGFDLIGREYVPMGTGPVGRNDRLLQVPLDPQQFVAPNGMVDLIVRNTVFVPFFAYTYESRFDLMYVGPQQP